MNRSLLFGGAAILLAFLAELAVLNHLLALRKTRLLLEASLSAVYQKRADLIPWLLVTVQEYKSLSSLTTSEILSLRAAGYAEHDFNLQLDLQSKLVALINGIVAQGEKNSRLRADIDFLSIRQKLTDCEREIGHLTEERGVAITSYDRLKNSWYALPIRPVISLLKN